MSKNDMWGGRFSGGPAEIMEKINASIGFDKNLYKQDIQGSLAHSDMLAAQGIITTQDRDAIHQGLAEIQQEIEAGTFDFKTELEDIHMNVEARLREKIGDPGARLHTGRSRNDQVITDVRLWTRDALDGLDALMADLQRALIDKAEAHADVLMPGYTHLQSAQPVTFGHHLMAYVEMVGRDRGRLADCRRRLNECPLGAAALAGTSFPIDRQMTAKALGFDRPTANSMDSVGSRDFILEFLAAGSIHAIHLSRLAEEIVMWMSDRFAFISLSDAFTTGSSIMPQKKNPDAAELVRGHAGRIIGCATSLMITMKGLPLAYSKDMQDDKPPVFEAAGLLELCIAAMTGMVADATFNTARMREAAELGYATATDLADWLVREADIPFREAHHITGAAVKLADSRGCALDELPLEDLKAIDARIDDRVFAALSVDASVAARASYGGTAPEQVRKQVNEARKALGMDE